jgi:hypothetical protein
MDQGDVHHIAPNTFDPSSGLTMVKWVAAGQKYCRAFGQWLAEHGFDAMRPSDRSHAIELHENLAAIVAWRATLSDRERDRLRGAEINVKRWRASTGHTPATAYVL